MKLFEPIRIGSMTLKNRVAFGPTHMGYCTDKGEVTDQLLCHYSARARGGVGLVIVEGAGFTGKYAFSMRRGLACMGDPYRKGLKELAEVIHFAGAKAVVQIVLGQGAQALFRHPRRDLVGPSAVPARIDQRNLPKPLKMIGEVQGEPPRPLTTDEIEELIRGAITAARTLKEAGFDGVELHGAHGYLVAEFISPLFNQRQDAYGGTFDKRLALPLRLIEGVRETVGEKFVIGFRISGSEHVEGGLEIEDSVRAARRFEEAGLDYLHVSSGCYQALRWTFPESEGLMLAEAKAFKQGLGIPVICPNIHDPRTAEKAIRQGAMDVASLCRALLVDPDWPIKALEERFDEIRRCVFCFTCAKSIMIEGTGVRCSQNPELGWERFLPKTYPIPPHRSGTKEGSSVG
ncbi:MAG: NADH:flavin oxidoreductase [Deltaproteobacteria bacterium]|nr:NADH:flavin oxidoreductase [Deltaproteobacteria bacterium]